jgi:hypothetical protein
MPAIGINEVSVVGISSVYRGQAILQAPSDRKREISYFKVESHFEDKVLHRPKRS